MAKLTARTSIISSHMPASADFPIVCSTLRLKEHPYAGIIRLQGSAKNPQFATAILDVCGVELPAPGNVSQSPHCEIAWAGPKEWLIFVSAEAQYVLSTALSAALKGVFATVTVISDSRICFALSGVSGWEFLSKLSSVDFDPQVFVERKVIITRFANQPAMIVHESAGEYRIYIEVSLAGATLGYLVEAAKEFMNS